MYTDTLPLPLPLPLPLNWAGNNSQTSDIFWFCLIKGLFGLPLHYVWAIIYTLYLSIWVTYMSCIYMYIYTYMYMMHIMSCLMSDQNLAMAEQNSLCSDKFDEHNYLSYYFQLCHYHWHHWPQFLTLCSPPAVRRSRGRPPSWPGSWSLATWP